MTKGTNRERRKRPASEDASERARLEAGSLPWGYGDERITALVRSPDTLYIYWELTDAGIDAARGRLGSAGRQGWFNVRIYDTSSRDFDGTNAHHYSDITVDRATRDYFLTVGRPGSTAHVEIGIKTQEGFFQAIARSNRADFPRRSPSPNTSIEWMTVTTGDDVPSARPYVSRHAEPPLPAAGPPPGDPSTPAESGPVTRAWTALGASEVFGWGASMTASSTMAQMASSPGGASDWLWLFAGASEELGSPKGGR